jgi:hypothetical protein
MGEITKQEHYTNLVNTMLQRELDSIKKIEKEIEDILKADLIDIDTKAIRVFEEIQRIKFDSNIFRELHFMKQD